MTDSDKVKGYIKEGDTHLVARNMPATFRDQLIRALVDFWLGGCDFVL